jgi:hypothetical protein
VPSAECYTGVNHPRLSGSSPRTTARNRSWIRSVTGPRRPLPTAIRSTLRIGVTSAAVPVKKS